VASSRQHHRGAGVSADRQGREDKRRTADRPQQSSRRTPPASGSILAFAGHSLRSGFLTSAAARGASIFKMADQSRHKSMDTLRGYVRDAEIFKDHAGKGLL